MQDDSSSSKLVGYLNLNLDDIFKHVLHTSIRLIARRAHRKTAGNVELNLETLMALQNS
jgi:hypothetical protein